MTFSEALQELMNGSKVKNNSWTHGYIMLDYLGYAICEDNNNYVINKHDFDSTWSVYDK